MPVDQVVQKTQPMEGFELNEPYESYESGDQLVNIPTWDGEDSECKALQVLKMLRKKTIFDQSQWLM